MIGDSYIDIFRFYGSILIGAFVIFMIFCIIFLPVFVFQIRNAIRKISMQLDQIIEISRKP